MVRVFAGIVLAFVLLHASGPVVAGENGPPPLALGIINAGSADPARLMKGLSGVVAAGREVQARFTWDVGRGEVANPLGEIVASVSEGDLETQLGHLQGVIDKWNTLRQLERNPAGRLDMALEPERELYHEGDKVTVMVGGNHHPYFLLFGIAAVGIVTVLYPADDPRYADPPTIPPGGPHMLSFEVTPPFGTDHFIAVAAAAPMTALIAELRTFDGKAEAASIPDLFERHLVGQTFELGVLGVTSSK